MRLWAIVFGRTGQPFAGGWPAGLGEFVDRGEVFGFVEQLVYLSKQVVKRTNDLFS
jgi:hypothetical protein